MLTRDDFIEFTEALMIRNWCSRTWYHGYCSICPRRGDDGHCAVAFRVNEAQRKIDAEKGRPDIQD